MVTAALPLPSHGEIRKLLRLAASVPVLGWDRRAGRQMGRRLRALSLERLQQQSTRRQRWLAGILLSL
jgi:hypothetical protein